MGDSACSGCESIAGKFYPRPHADYGSTCLGLIHSETLRDPTDQQVKTIYSCDLCNANSENLPATTLSGLDR